MTKIAAGFTAGLLALAGPTYAAEPLLLGLGDSSGKEGELALYIAGAAVVVAVLIAVSDGPADDEPVSP